VLDVEPSRLRTATTASWACRNCSSIIIWRNTSGPLRFYSMRVGIQPFQSDFRGFLFNDSQLGIRLFGNRDNNRFQYQSRGLLAAGEGYEQRPQRYAIAAQRFLFLANLYRQDFPVPGLTSQITSVYNMNREKRDVEIDIMVSRCGPALLGDLRGREYDVVYLGYNADGRIGRINLTASLLWRWVRTGTAFSRAKPAKSARASRRPSSSYDNDWMRFRLSGLYASGDGDPYDKTENGFDAIFENPIFAGADTSYWIRQRSPLLAAGASSDQRAQRHIELAAFLEGTGAVQLQQSGHRAYRRGRGFRPDARAALSANANHLWFQNTATLQALRTEGSIPKAIGWDLSVAAIWRPKATQNIVGRLSATSAVAGQVFKDLFDNKRRTDAYVSVLANVIVSF
jgi:hypothetical protein